jgi:hypothetical protein
VVGGGSVSPIMLPSLEKITAAVSDMHKWELQDDLGKSIGRLSVTVAPLRVKRQQIGAPDEFATELMML